MRTLSIVFIVGFTVGVSGASADLKLSLVDRRENSGFALYRSGQPKMKK